MLHIKNVTFLTKQDILVYSHLCKGDRNNGQMSGNTDKIFQIGRRRPLL